MVVDGNRSCYRGKGREIQTVTDLTHPRAVKKTVLKKKPLQILKQCYAILSRVFYFFPEDGTTL